MLNKQSLLNKPPVDFTRNAPATWCVSGFLPFLFLVLCIAGFSLLWAAPSWALGISPASIQVNDLSSQSRIQKELYISRANPKATEYASITLSGSGINAILIDQKEKFELPQGVQNTPLPFTLAPKGFPLGTYEAFITISPIQTEALTGGNSILAGTQAHVIFTITNEDTQDFSLGQTQIENHGGENLFLSFQATNNRQDEITFGKIELEIQNQKPGEIQKIKIETSKAQPLLPFSQQQYSLPVSAELPASMYSATLYLFDQDQIPLGQQDFTFSLQDEVEPEITKETSNKNFPSWLVIKISGLIGLAGLGIISLIYFLMRKNHTSKR